MVDLSKPFTSSNTILKEWNFTTTEVMTNNNTGCFQYENTPTSITVQFFMSLLILTLNSIVLGIVIKNSKKTFRKPAFIFISALSITDILLSFSILTYNFLYIGNYQFNAKTWINISGITSVCFNASVNFLLAIAFDRLLLIAYNRRYKNLMKQRNIVIVIVICLVVAILPVLPFAGNHGLCIEHCICVHGKLLTCPGPTCSNVLQGFSKPFLFGLFFYFLVMLIAISIVYVILFWKVHRRGNKVQSHGTEMSTRRMKREYQLARTLVLVVGLFCACWLPQMSLYLADYADDNFYISGVALNIIFVPTILNSILNPIIYAARIPLLKNALCSCARKTESSSSDATNPKSNKFLRFNASKQKARNSIKGSSVKKPAVSTRDNTEASGTISNGQADDKSSAASKPSCNDNGNNVHSHNEIISNTIIGKKTYEISI